jgi:Trk K+ transport system NAD-binding subunit
MDDINNLDESLEVFEIATNEVSSYEFTTEELEDALNQQEETNKYAARLENQRYNLMNDRLEQLRLMARFFTAGVGVQIRAGNTTLQDDDRAVVQAKRRATVAVLNQIERICNQDLQL